MRMREESPLDPEIAAVLAAIDARLAGEAADPAHAEVAELALLLTAERPEIDREFSGWLDRLLERRFAADSEPRPGSVSARPASASGRERRRPPMANWRRAGGIATAVAAVIAALIVVLGSGGSSQLPSDVSGPAPIVGAGGLARTAGGASSATSAANTPSPQAAKTNGPSGYVSPQPNGRKTVQSAQLQLNTQPNRIDQVAQEAFTVIGEERGIVEHSSVNAGGASGDASFTLSIPNANLATTMSRLSTLRFASVASRTDSSQDVNNQYLSTTRELADHRALRTSLLKQLATAVTTEAITSLNGRIHDAEATINSEQTTLNRLNREVGYSQLQLSVQSGAGATGPGGVPGGDSGGFTLHRAAHDAGRVLVVALGVAMITLAVLLPLGLLAVLALWLAAGWRRRGRRQALDAA